jgi:hypothetical protein
VWLLSDGSAPPKRLRLGKWKSAQRPGAALLEAQIASAGRQVSTRRPKTLQEARPAQWATACLSCPGARWA